MPRMRNHIKKYLLDVVQIVYYFTWFVVSTICFYFIFKTNTVISYLEKNQISVYFVKDTIILLFFIFLILGLFSSFIETLLKKDFSFLSTFFGPIRILLFSAYFAVGYDYGNVSRFEIGWFYKMPIGESISYPK